MSSLTDDPFWRQKSQRLDSRKKILNALQHSLTFGELRRAVGLSPPVLSKYVKTLVEEELIEQKVIARRVVYQRTNRGEELAGFQRRSLQDTFAILKHVARNPSLMEPFSELVRLPQEEQELADLVTRWIIDFSLLLISEDGLRWIKNHPGEEGGKRFKERVKKELGEYQRPGARKEELDLASTLPRLLITMRKVLAEDQAESRI